MNELIACCVEQLVPIGNALCVYQCLAVRFLHPFMKAYPYFTSFSKAFKRNFKTFLSLILGYMYMAGSTICKFRISSDPKKP